MAGGSLSCRTRWMAVSDLIWTPYSTVAVVAIATGHASKMEKTVVLLVPFSLQLFPFQAQFPQFCGFARGLAV